MLIAIPIALLISWALFRYKWRLITATAASAFATSVVTWAFTANHFGWLDETFLQNVVVVVLVSVGVSLLFGYWLRRPQSKDAP